MPGATRRRRSSSAGMVTQFELVLPRRIIFGTGEFSRLGELTAALGRSALLCSGRSAVRKAGWLERAQCLFGERGVRAEIFEGINHDPDLAICEAGIAHARRVGCDVVVAIGGGSVLDVGKTISAIAPQPRDLRHYFHGGLPLDRAPLPFVAVPTTAGTGAECTNNAVLSDPERRIKKSLRDARMVPSVALVDPALTLTAPPGVTAQSGMDALCQAVECFVTKAANPVTDSLALRAIELIASNLPLAVSRGDSLAHREPVTLGSLMTGMAFGNSGLGAVHGLAHPLGIRFGIPHGLVCAVLLPHVCEFNLPVRREKFAVMAPLLGASGPDEVPRALADMNRRLGIPERLTGFGVTEADLPAIIADSRSGSMARNPRPPSDEDLADILKKVI